MKALRQCQCHLDPYRLLTSSTDFSRVAYPDGSELITATTSRKVRCENCGVVELINEVNQGVFPPYRHRPRDVARLWWQLAWAWLVRKLHRKRGE